MIILDRLDNETGKEYAYRVIKYNIMDLTLEPGQKISESELAQQLNISRTPIREVLMKLKEENLIDVKPQSGTYISLIDNRLVEQAFFMRYCLEKEAMKLACTNFREDMLDSIELNLIKQKRISDKSENELEFHQLDIEFHSIIFSAVNLEEVWKSILRISTHYNRARLISELKFCHEYYYDSHKKFVEAIKNKDINAVDELVKDHIKRPKEKWNIIFNEEPKYKNYFK